LRFKPPARLEIERLVNTANSPEIAIPWPTAPSETCSSAAMGVSRLTGMNSEATKAKAPKDMAMTPPQCAGWGSL
jgi:hypothetical protein